MSNIMIDIETLSTKSNAAILSIGAVEFSDLGEQISTFQITIDIQSCLDKGLQIDGSTLYWWLTQSHKARDGIGKKPQLLVPALAAFKAWVLSVGNLPSIWSYGADFDIPILSSAFLACDFSIPWGYNRARCFRTFKALYPTPELPRVGTYHNALDDAKFQVASFKASVEQYGLSL